MPHHSHPDDHGRGYSRTGGAHGSGGRDQLRVDAAIAHELRRG